jgi:hypothetical protein
VAAAATVRFGRCPTKKRSPEVTYEIVEGRAMLVDPSGTELLTLNPVGTLVWEALDGKRDIEELIDQLLPQFVDVSREELEQDVVEFLEELESSELIVDA